MRIGYTNMMQHTPRQIMKMIRMDCLHTSSQELAADIVHVPGFKSLYWMDVKVPETI